jgi:hypothetical protein
VLWYEQKRAGPHNRHFPIIMPSYCWMMDGAFRNLTTAACCISYYLKCKKCWVYLRNLTNMYQVTGLVIYVGHPFDVSEMNETFGKLRLLISFFLFFNIQYHRRYCISLGTFRIVRYITSQYNSGAYWIVPDCYCILHQPLPQPFEEFTRFS